MHVPSFLAALVALLSLHSLSLSPLLANAQFQLRHKASTTPTTSLSAPDPISRRQHHEPRDILDICAFVDAHILLIDLKICLCLSALPVALESDIALKALVGILGVQEVTALVTTLINDAPTKKHCHCPQNGHLTCTPSDPCHVTCDPPYVSEGGQCVCKHPYMECNGKCASYPHGCGSAVPYLGSLRRSSRRRQYTS